MAPQMPGSLRAGVVAGFAAIYLIWGSTYLAIRLGVADIPPFLMAGVRFLLGGIAFISWAQYRGAKISYRPLRGRYDEGPSKGLSI